MSSETTLEHHPIANIWPMMGEEQYQELKSDIEQNGCINKIWLYEGKILDGRNRYKACQELNQHFSFLEYKGDEPIQFAISLNMKRRHLTSAQKAALAVKIEPMFAAESKKRQQAAGGNHNPEGRNQHTEEELRTVNKKIYQPTNNEPKKRKEQALQQAAKALNTNHVYVSQAKKIEKESPETFELLLEGKVSMKDASKEIRKKPVKDWTEDEKQRKAEVESGMTVLANQERDKNLLQWAEKNKCLVRIDRGSKWGNPFLIGDDGDRDEVCEKFEKFYFPNKNKLLQQIEKLKGKVLSCHCYPERCHGLTLISELKKEL
jgi:hypothetical protein